MQYLHQVDITKTYHDRTYVEAVADCWRKLHPDWSVQVRNVDTFGLEPIPYYAVAFVTKNTDLFARIEAEVAAAEGNHPMYQVWQHKTSGELYLAKVAGDHTLSFVGMPFSRADLTDRSHDALDDLWHNQTIGDVVTIKLADALTDYTISH